MNDLSKECKQDIILYRELFLNSSKSLNDYFLGLKNAFCCQKCQKCCEILYLDISPSGIISQKKDKKMFEKFLNLFIPFGSDKFEDVDPAINHKLAKQVNLEFVERVLSSVKKEIFFYHCKHFDKKCSKNLPSACACIEYPTSPICALHKDCSYIEWQKFILEKINTEIGRDILIKLKQINNYRNEFKCNRTGTCCRLACSEFSFDELKEKAKNGDKFASEFTSVFIPYDSQEKARDIYPEFVDMVKEKFEQIYFYHCPHITDDNLCSIYEKRPQLCRDFPDNPLSILPETCGFCQWKKEVEFSALLMHGLIEICDFYKEKIGKQLNH